MLLPNFSWIGPAVWPEKFKLETDGRSVHDDDTLSRFPIPDKLKTSPSQMNFFYILLMVLNRMRVKVRVRVRRDD